VELTADQSEFPVYPVFLASLAFPAFPASPAFPVFLAFLAYLVCPAFPVCLAKWECLEFREWKESSVFPDRPGWQAAKREARLVRPAGTVAWDRLARVPESSGLPAAASGV
jgi:hypothetical protein